jgi:hypothetical protein
VLFRKKCGTSLAQDSDIANISLTTANFKFLGIFIIPPSLSITTLKRAFFVGLKYLFFMSAVVIPNFGHYLWRKHFLILKFFTEKLSPRPEGLPRNTAKLRQ